MKTRSALSRAFCGKSLALLAIAHLASCATSQSEVKAVPPLTVEWPLDNFRVGGYPTRMAGVPVIKDVGRGPSVCFSGADDGLIAAINPLDMQTSFTIEALIKPLPGGGPVQQFLHVEDSEGNKIILQLNMGAGDLFKVHTFAQIFETKLDLENELSRHKADQWYWVALTSDGDGVKLYLNGLEEARARLALDPMKSGQLGLGFKISEENYFKGCIRELRFANAALPPEKLAKAP